MISNKAFICETCKYATNRKYNLELHNRSPNSCKRRLKREDDLNVCQNVANMGVSVTLIAKMLQIWAFL